MITLKTLPAATLMEVFQQCSDHLLQQGAKSIKDDGSCQYKNGSMSCAAGCFISDEEYDPAMESIAWDGLVEKSRFKAPENHRILISDMQHIHDDHPVEEWPERLAELKADIIQHPENFS
jgi:hypothetical protein